ncbi:MAG: DUF4367 domain-containing protein [Clostridia bacterium]|nr:DUF4367 domain-containing protein [Clostridia bacterium]
MTFTQKEKAIIYEALDLYCIEFCKTLPTNEELSHITFSEEFERKMQKLIDRQKKFYYYWFNTVGKRVAAIILVLLLSLTTITFSVKALREPVIRFIVETYEKFSSVVFINDKTEENTSVDFVLEKVVPAYIPDEFTEESTFEDESGFQTVYISNDGSKSIMIMQIVNDEAIAKANTENVTYQNIMIAEHPAIYYSNKGTNTIIISGEQYIFTVEGTIEKEELVKIVESIKIN